VSDPAPVDRGLASERTSLAWNRSGLAILACIAVLLRRIWPLDSVGRVVALVCIAAGSVMWAVALLMSRRLSGGAGELRPMSSGRAAAITAGTLAVALAGLLLAFFAPS